MITVVSIANMVSYSEILMDICEPFVLFCSVLFTHLGTLFVSCSFCVDCF